MGFIWLNLASFTPSGEAENKATVASFGIPLTPTHCTSVRPLWPRLASSRVTRRGEILIRLHLVAFRCIPCRLHRPGMRGSRLRGNDVCDQCSNQRGYRVMGSCRWLAFEGWACVWDGVTSEGFANRPYIHTKGRMRGSRLRGSDGGTAPTPEQTRTRDRDARFPPTRGATGTLSLWRRQAMLGVVLL